MCLICVELDKQRMSFREARRAMGEMREKVGEKHIAEVEVKVAQGEAEAAALAQTVDPAATP